MNSKVLQLLYVTHMPPSPPRFGAQARMHGLMTSLARRHDLTAVSLVDENYDADECARAMRDYCREVVVVPNSHARQGIEKRAQQLRSLVSSHSYEQRHFTVPALERALEELNGRRTFDLVNLEFPFLARYLVRGFRMPRPPLVLDAHGVEHDILRQVAVQANASLRRRVYSAFDWRKVRREELAAWAAADGITTCSDLDAARIRAVLPQARLAVVPNAADVDFFHPRAGADVGDGKTVLFFGALNYFPNVDAVFFLLREIWPIVAARMPDARLTIVGPRPPPEVLALRGERIEVTGFVDDLRPHLAQAAVVVVPLRVGGGTRLKIVEAMAMGKPIVSTALGAEGIDAGHGRELLLADDPRAFADAVCRLLGDPELARRLAHAGRSLAVERYSWDAAARTLEDFFHEVRSRGEQRERRRAS